MIKLGTAFLNTYYLKLISNYSKMDFRTFENSFRNKPGPKILFKRNHLFR